MDRTNRNTALACALVSELWRSGVAEAVISPGSRSTPLALALDAESKITTSVILDERVAGFFALGKAIATGRPVVVTCTSGTAAANLHPAVAEASEAGVPLLVLSADRPPELRGIGAGQTIDQIKLYGSAVRWFCEVGTHQADDPGLIHMRATACRAVSEATRGPRPGPVHLNLSWRDPLGAAPAEGEVTATSTLALSGRGEGPLTAAVGSLRLPSDDLVERIGGLLAKGGRGLIVAGRQTDPRLAPAVAELSRAGGLPILAEPTSQVRFGPHGGDAVIATYDSIARAAPSSLAPETVIRFGDMPTSRSLRDWLAGLRPTEIVVDPPGGWNDPGRTAALMVRSDPAALARGLARGMASPDRRWLNAWRQAELAARGAIESVLGESAGLSEPLVHHALGSAYRPGDAVLIGSSMPIRDQEAFALGSSSEVLFTANRGANGIDGSISTGAGIAAATGRPTWIVIGDLTLAHDLGGLAALATCSGPVRIFVIDNGGGGIFDFLPQAGEIEAKRFERLFTTPSGLDLAKVAALFELEYRAIGEVGEIAALGESEGHVLAHVRTDRSGNVDLHRSVAEAVRKALGEGGA